MTRYAAPAASLRRPATVSVATHTIVGALMDAQILAGYADQAIAAVSCPCSAAPASVAREALGRLRNLLRAEAGRLEGIA